MAIPIRSRLLDYFEAEPPAGPAQAGAQPQTQAGASDPQPRRSRLLDYVEYVEYTECSERSEHPEAEQSPGPKPGVPPYHTPVFVPAHPRYVDTADASSGTPTRIPYIAYELFGHPTDGTVALAFTTLDNLVAALGEAQPWVATSIGPLAEGMGEYGVTVLLDPTVATGQRNWQRADLAAYAREVR
ncbi:SAV_915 family protein [Streptomyces sp. NL15-2K]|uniref:SAV_915 family protein n=1 Tax=Streptomyces sp. NL15-2K TaxID=376149 RepID=UPI000FFAEFA3|nr:MULTISPECIES: SAV_915 family protein [Actinomycetes]WKX13071.1 hypothetical protein Q4V64_38320 [Kutzneria buriramensis]GCB45604.1 hypothetical protein SNL152K_2895 [Streptomyces sp. NL15-2K]